jgi:hypothetical protein
MVLALFSRRKDKDEIRCEHLVRYDGIHVNVAGIKIENFSVGQVSVERNILQAAFHALMLLDASQYDLCLAIKGLMDRGLRESYQKKMIDDKIRSQKIIQAIASLSISPESELLQTALKNLLLPVLEIEEEMEKSKLQQKPEPTDEKLSDNSLEIEDTTLKDKLQKLPLESPNMIGERLQFYETLYDDLKGSHRAFLDQVKIRNKLENLLGQNHDLSKYEYYEDMFSRLFPHMTPEEIKKFEQMRQITNRIRDYNFKIYELLKEDRNNRKFWRELPKLEDLYIHLEAWLEKYEALKDYKDVALVYVGPEELRPFPAGIDELIKEKIDSINKLSTKQN